MARAWAAAHLGGVQSRRRLEGEPRHLAVVHPVGVHDDEARLGLPEDVLKPDHVHRAGADDVLEKAAGTHRRQLVDVADEDELGCGLDPVQ